MNCEQLNEWMLAYLDGEVSDQQKTEIKTHLASCPACAAEHEALAALRADLSATVAAAGAAIELPPAAEARIASHLEAQVRKAQGPGPLAALWAHIKGPARALAGALVVALVMAACILNLVGPRIGPTPEPQVIIETVVVEQTKIVEGETIVEVEKEVSVEMTAAPEPTRAPMAMASPLPSPKPTFAPRSTASPMPAAEATPPGEQPVPDMSFQGYDVNPFIDTKDDPLSTFALDVDTGSYTIARRYVQDGRLPPEDAIRVEEFVNYFEQGYAYPPEGQAFALHVDGAPAPFTETERYRMMRIGIQGYAVPPEARKDVVLTFVIDVSGSMAQGNRLEMVKRALELLVEQLRASDSVSIVAYSTSARVILEPTPGTNQEAILRAIYALHPENSTNAEAGLRLGYRLANQAFNPEAINRVILCSDGVANVGLTGADSILEVIGERAREGITLTAIGVGMGNYNDVLLEQLADNGDGFYAYVDTLEEAKRLFTENLVSTLQVIARDAKVQVEFNPEVVFRYRLVGFENRAVADEAFRDDSVDAGEVGAGHSVTALYEVKLHPGAAGRIATVYLRWQDPNYDEAAEIYQEFFSDELAESFPDASPRFQNAVVVAEYAEILRGSYWAESNTLAGVLEEAERVAELLPNDPDVAEFVDLVRQASWIAGYR
jgi:Ca-activated chloride channel family protein